MNKLKKILTNKGSTAAYALLTAIFTVVPDDVFKTIIINKSWPESTNILINRTIICAVVFAISNIVYGIYRIITPHFAVL